MLVFRRKEMVKDVRVACVLGRVRIKREGERWRGWVVCWFRVLFFYFLRDVFKMKYG